MHDDVELTRVLHLLTRQVFINWRRLTLEEINVRSVSSARITLKIYDLINEETRWLT